MSSSGTWMDIAEEKFQFHEMHKMNQQDFKNIDLRNSNICAAKYGGPIAVTRNTEMIMISQADTLIREYICFFSNNGNLINKVEFKQKCNIVGFDYIEDEQLLVILDNGQYFLINPHPVPNPIQSFKLGEAFNEDKICEGKVFENSFAFRTKSNQFFLVEKVLEPHKIIQFVDPKLNSHPKAWVVIPKQHTLSEKVEIQISHEQAGIIVIVEDEGSNIYYNKYLIQNFQAELLPHIDNIVLICPSPNYNQIAYLSHVKKDNQYIWVLSILASNFQDEDIEQTQIEDLQDVLLEEQKTNPYNKNSTKLFAPLCPKNMQWCGNDGVVINTFHHYYMIKNKTVTTIKHQRRRGSLMITEMDGMRIITNREQDMCRQIIPEYVQVFKNWSTEPGALLLDQYQQFEDREPIEYEDMFKQDKNLLATAVEECIQASTFELNQEKQAKLLKAAIHGKTYILNDLIDHNLIGEVCKYIRILNSLRTEESARVITYKQLTEMKESLLIKLLLRYNQHYKAIEICKHLNLQNNIKNHIYIHWASQKVMQDTDMSDDELCEVIRQRLENQHVSFTEISKQALQVGKSSLALKLLELENSISKKVPVLLWMGYYDSSNQITQKYYFESALDEAVRSKDSNLINLAIMKILASNIEDEHKFEILSMNEISNQHLKNYLKNFDEYQYQQYLQSINDSEELGFFAMEQAYSSMDIANRVQLLKIASEHFAGSSPFYQQQIEKEVQLIEDFKEKKDYRSKDTKGVYQQFDQKPVNDIFYTFMRGGHMQQAELFRKQFGISEKRFIIARVKVLIEQKEWALLANYLQQQNKKKQIIPYELVADLIIKAGDKKQGVNFILKMPDVEEQVSILLRIGETRTAIKSAIYHKKLELLMDIRTQIYNPDDIMYLDEYLSKHQ